MCGLDGTGSLAKFVETVLQIFKSIKFHNQLNKYHMFSEVPVPWNEITYCYFELLFVIVVVVLA
jgi:hypothetical protein